MDLHGLRVNVWFERVEGVWKRRQSVSHLGGCSLSRSGGHNLSPVYPFLPHNYTRLDAKRVNGCGNFPGAALAREAPRQMERAEIKGAENAIS
jgi:hypothetical protein